MNAYEHFREAERLLTEAGKIGVVITVPKDVSIDAATRLHNDFEAETGSRPIVMGGGSTADVGPLLAKAQVHATLALTAALDPQIVPVKRSTSSTPDPWAEAGS